MFKIDCYETILGTRLFERYLEGLVKVETVAVGKRIRKYYIITKQGHVKKQVQMTSKQNI